MARYPESFILKQQKIMMFLVDRFALTETEIQYVEQKYKLLKGKVSSPIESPKFEQELKNFSERFEESMGFSLHDACFDIILL